MSPSTINIPRSSASSATSTPSASPTTEHHDRLNALLATFEAGTHAFSRDVEWSDGARVSKALAKPAAQQPQPQRRPSWASALSLLSLTRPANGSAASQHRHFDPSREPKLHGLP